MPSNIIWFNGCVDRQGREELLGQKACTIWLTGLSGSGKSTLSAALDQTLFAAGRACFVIDGDNVRHGLNKNLGFVAADRSENIRRVAEVAKLMNDAGLVVITALISPFRQDREMAREIIGAENFIEVHVSTSLEVCESRDPKGLYAKARDGSLPDFTGVSSPYEAPGTPDWVVDTGVTKLKPAVAKLADIVLEHCSRLPKREAGKSRSYAGTLRSQMP
jgi:adenylylsulfate kinase